LAEIKDKKVRKEKNACFYCGKAYVDTNFYSSNSIFYNSTGKLPYCKQCIERLYQYYSNKYAEDGYPFPEKKAVKRLCMAFDIYYREDVFNSSIRNYKESDVSTSPMSQYMKVIQLFQYNRHKETYENTLLKEEENMTFKDVIEAPVDLPTNFKINDDIVDFFGAGFSNDDYEFLWKEYQDWTGRHECNTKAQEEVFKDICFNRLQNLKALRRGEDTKDITASFQKMLDAGKLQPKQNSGDATADNQTFGTLIDKWENDRPLPEIDEELKDVDRIGWYIDVFFKGHLSKMMGLKNGLSNLYTKFMKKYTVEKPEYNDEENSEVLFDAIFGNSSSELDDDKAVM
jgi:hypothetical protein